MNRMIIGLVALAAATAFGAEAKDPAAYRKFLEKTGGIVSSRGDGKVAVLNAQDKFDAAVVSESAANFAKVFHVNVETSKADGWTLASGVPSGANIAVYVVSDDALPMSLVAVEAGWGVVNVAKMSKPKQLRNEFARVMTLVAGAAVSQYPASVMQCVKGVSDLDRIIKDGYTIDCVTGIDKNLAARGVTKSKTGSYRRACIEGWAAMPTNEFQKAIWDSIHAIPEKPIKIQFDQKRDAGK